MMKIISILGLVIFLASPVYGGENESNYSANPEKIYDQADLLSQSEENKLLELIETYAHQTELDFVIVTTNDVGNKSSELYADDFYDDNKFGYDYPCGSGALLLIDMDNRQVVISTAGKAMNDISQKQIDNILDEIAPKLTSGDYADAGSIFVKTISGYITGEIKEKNLFSHLQNPLISGIIALVISGVAVLIMSGTSKTAVTVGGRTYMDSNTLRYTNRVDQFTHTTTTRRKIETSSSSGGGVRTSSSGRSHGGGSRGF